MSNYTSKFIARFWSKVDRTNNPDECWLWKPDQTQRYGKITIRKKIIKAHRVSYELEYGSFDQTLCVLHTCDTPRCVNPNHLFLGTVLDNNRDRSKKGRSNPLRGDKHPSSKLSDENVRHIRDLYANGDISQQKLAEMFNVSQVQVSNIINKKQRR